MKSQAEMIEGPDAFKRFEEIMRKVVQVPHETVQKKIEEHRERSAANPRRRGPKRKA